MLKVSVIIEFFIALLLALRPSANSYCQVAINPLIKVGGYTYFSHSRYLGFSVNLEYEKTFKRKEFLTHGPRLDYYRMRPYPEKYFYGIENLSLGYELKVYPFYYRSHKPYHGISLGLYPCYYVKTNQYYRYGPGLGSLFGYQYLFKNKVSAAIETSVIYFQNVNPNVYKKNPVDRYYLLFISIKVGLKLRSGKD